MPDRQPWELSYTIRLNFAATFLKYLSVEGRERAMLEMAYHCSNMHAWARDRVSETLAVAEQKRGGRELSEAGCEAVRGAVEALEKAGLFGKEGKL